MKVLLVDDSELDLMINRKIIEMTYNESKVSSFEDSDAFFSYVESAEKPDLIISDMQMPKTSGLELADKFIGKFGEGYVKLVLLTAYVDEAIQKKVNAVSNNIRLVEKPLNQSILKGLLS